MTEKTQKNIKGLKSIAAGYLVIAAMLFVMQLLRLVMIKNAAEYLALLVEFAAWGLICYGFLRLRDKGPAFFKGFLAAGAGAFFTVLEAFFVHRNLSWGMGEDAYIDFYVVFCFFMTRVALLYSFAKVLEGTAGWAKYVGFFSGTNAAFRRGWLPIAAILFPALILIQIAGMFDRPIWIGGVAFFGAAAFLAQVWMARKVNLIYSACKGKDLPRQRADSKNRRAAAKKEKRQLPWADKFKKKETMADALAEETLMEEDPFAEYVPTEDPFAEDVQEEDPFAEEAPAVDVRDLPVWATAHKWPMPAPENAGAAPAEAEATGKAEAAPEEAEATDKTEAASDKTEAAPEEAMASDKAEATPEETEPVASDNAETAPENTEAPEEPAATTGTDDVAGIAAAPVRLTDTLYLDKTARKSLGKKPGKPPKRKPKSKQ